MATWPATLPQEPIEDGYQESLANNLLRTSMDVGPAKVRRRSAINCATMTIQLKLSTTELATFKSFCLSDLHSCVDTIQWLHPQTGESVDLRFTAPPSWTPAGEGYFLVTMQLEVMP